MNALDRVLGYFAPTSALRRAAARDMLRNYAAGSQGRLAQGWAPPRNAPDNVLESGRGLMVARGRDLGRNNAWVGHALRRLPAAIVGVGPTPSIQGTKVVRTQVGADWAEFCEAGDDAGGLSFGANLALAVRTLVETGEVFVVWTNEPAAAGLRVPLSYRLLPGDFLDTRMNGVAPLAKTEGGIVRYGIEYDKRGKVVAYWLYDRHPFDTDFIVAVPTSTRYSADQVDHVFERLWIGQRRGVPWLAPTAIPADDLAQYETAALWKARMAASLGLTIENTGPTPSSLGAQTTDSNGRTLEQLAPGAILRLRPGEKASQVSPPPDDNFGEFWRSRLYAIAAGLGMPYASLTGDLKQANYSSLREGKLLFWELLDCWQWHIIHDQLLRPAWRRFGRARYAAGRTSGGVLPGVKWSFPRRPWVDPAKDVAALEKELDLGLASWPDAVAARGEDPEEQVGEIGAWRKPLAAVGIAFGRAPGGGAPAAAGAPGAADPAAAEAGDSAQAQGATTTDGASDAEAEGDDVEAAVTE